MATFSWLVIDASEPSMNSDDETPGPRGPRDGCSAAVNDISLNSAEQGYKTIDTTVFMDHNAKLVLFIDFGFLCDFYKYGVRTPFR